MALSESPQSQVAARSRGSDRSPPLIAERSRLVISSRLDDKFSQAARFASIASVLLGCSVLVGWALNIAWLKGFLPGLPPMKANAAIAFIAIGLGLKLRFKRNASRLQLMFSSACAVFAALLGALSLLEDLSGLDFGIDQLLFVDPEPRVAPGAPGRMAPGTSINFILFGVASVWLDARSERRATLARWCAITAILVGAAPALGYLYRVPLYSVHIYNWMAVNAAVAFMLLGVGVLCARPEHPLIVAISSDTASGSGSRRLIPTLIAIPISAGWLALAGARRGLFPIEYGIGLCALASSVCLVGVAAWNARSLGLSELRRAELKSQIAEQNAETQAAARMRGLAESLKDALIAVDLRGRIIEWNGAATKLFGYSHAEALGMSLQKLMPERFRVAHSAAIARLAHGGEPRLLGGTMECAALRRDGAEFPCELSLSSWELGGERFYTGHIRDRGECERAQLAAAHSEERFRNIVERALSGIVVTHDDGQIVYANPALLRMLGYRTSAELAGRQLLELVHPDAKASVAEQLANTLAGKAGSEIAVSRYRRQDGSELLAEGTCIAMDFDGAPSVLSLLRDVTERERAERLRLTAENSLRESLLEKEVLLKEIHHRVKNNLQIIVSLINLQSDRMSDERGQSLFEDMRGRVYSIALLHERLYRARDLRHVDMHEYLEGLVHDLWRANSDVQKAIEVRVSASGIYLDLPTAVPVGLLVNELVTNSLKHAFPRGTRSRGSIDVQIYREGERFALLVADDGVGLPSSFDTRGVDSLGMLLVTSLSRQLDGQLSVDSGHGARWLLKFPESQRAGAAA